MLWALPTWLECIFRYSYMISEVSLIEYVEIVAHYNRSANGPRVDTRINGSRYSGEQLKALKEQMGKDKMRSLNLIIDDPDRFVCHRFSYYFELYSAFQKGILPYKGALVDQPNKIIEIFNIFAMLDLERQEKHIKEMERSKRSGKRRN